MTSLQWDPAPPTPPPSSGMPWGPGRAFAGLAAGAATFIVAGIVGLLIIAALDLEGTTSDVGGPFERAGTVAEYADERLRAAASGEAIPDPPTIVADVASLRAVFAATLGHQAFLVAVTVLVTGLGWARFRRETGLDHFDWSGTWRPALGALGAYLVVVMYQAIAIASDVDILIPESVIPVSVGQDTATLALVGVLAVIAAPFAEEVFFRGFFFGGLARWGFWPAALISSLVFASFHLDVGSLIPFTLVGIILAWLFWRRRNLWDAVLCHAFFNGASFVLLVLGAAT